MLNFLMNNMNILSIFDFAGNCKSYLGKDLVILLNDIFTWVEYSVPGLLAILCSFDMAKAVVSQDDKGMKAAVPRIIKRIIIGVAIFFIPILLNAILILAGFASGVCGIGM